MNEQQQLDPERWEEICQRCGECCFEKKIDPSGKVLSTVVPCRFLDIHSRDCRIYHHRLEAEFDCIKLTPEIIIQLDWLPKNCAYRKFSNDPEK